VWQTYDRRGSLKLRSELVGAIILLFLVIFVFPKPPTYEQVAERNRAAFDTCLGATPDQVIAVLGPPSLVQYINDDTLLIWVGKCAAPGEVVHDCSLTLWVNSKGVIYKWQSKGYAV